MGAIGINQEGYTFIRAKAGAGRICVHIHPATPAGQIPRPSGRTNSEDKLVMPRCLRRVFNWQC